jgi:hypothetical protein
MGKPLKPLSDTRADDVARNGYINLGTFFCAMLGVGLGIFLGGIWLLLTPFIFGYLGRRMIKGILEWASSAIAGAVLPDARGGAGVGYSHIEAIEIKGDIAGALVAWEQVIVETPDALHARISAAELHTRKANNHARAAELYRSVQVHANAPDETKRYVTQRLIDLYLGPLNDEGRALVELRRVANRWPDSPEGKGALQAIANIKKL